ncbi:MAG: hypothetical protein ACI3YK_05120 [Eubacteriales bacterium]
MVRESNHHSVDFGQIDAVSDGGLPDEGLSLCNGYVQGPCKRQESIAVAVFRRIGGDYGGDMDF